MKTRHLFVTVLLACMLLSACAPAAKTIAPTTYSPTGRTYPTSASNSTDKVYPTAASVAKEQIAQATMAPQTSIARATEAAPAGQKPIAGPTSSAYKPTAVPPQGNTFQDYGVNPFVDAREEHLSTFGLDVDTASYTVMRQYINDGSLPPADSVRLEEYVNYFKMGYQSSPDVAFAIYADGAPSPFTQDGTYILRFGIQGYQVSEVNRKPSNLVFVIDVSGSMSRDNRLELVKQSLQLLVDRLREDDTIGIVAFSTDARVVLEPTSAANKDAILESMNSLHPENTTNVEAGLTLGYDMAMRAYRQGGNNRVILCSDGVANTGTTDSSGILDRIHGYVAEGITLTTVGVGMGNFNDALLEQMADKGNGSYSYIDNIDEARRLFVDHLTSTLQVIARDAKVQVDFNPDVVDSFRLLGYENRAIANQDFRNDSVDAGEIGAGHSATAIYAVKLIPGAQGRIATVQLRWKEPDTYQVREINGNFNTFDLLASFDQADPNYQLAVVVAQFAEVLRNSPYAYNPSRYPLREYADRLVEMIPEDQDVIEFANLVDRANQINPGLIR